MNDISTPVEEPQIVQLFSVREILHPLAGEDWVQHLEEKLVLTAYRQGYGLVQTAQRTERKEPSFLIPHQNATVIELRATGVKLHG